MQKVILTGGSRGLGKAIKNRMPFIYYGITDYSRSTGYDLTKTIPDIPADTDVLILNAGVWKNDFKLNYEVPKQMAELAPKGCHVIFILSNAAYQNFGNDNYSTAKAGLLLYIRRKQKEGYKFSAICPGTMNTDFWKDAEVDNRLKGAMEPQTVAELVYACIKAGEQGALITEMTVLPEKK